MKHGTSPQGRQEGFILLTVLAILVVLVMLAAVAATTANRVRQDQQRDNAQLAGELAAHSTRATVIYLLATQRMTFAGLTVDDQVVYTPSELYEKQHGMEDTPSLMPVGNELRMNGKVYAGLGGTRFALRTDNSRFNLNWKPALREKWLTRLGVSSGQQAILVDTLLDYQDPDDLRRINGAEAEQYQKQNHPAPPNRTLFTPLELRQVSGWGKVLSKLDDAALLRIFNVDANGPLDINAAPLSSLLLLPGVTRQQAERIVALRNLKAFTQLEDVYALLPSLRSPDPVITLYPKNSGTITVWPSATIGGAVIHYTLTPFDDGGSPWHIDYEIRLPARQDDGRSPAGQPQTPLLGYTQTAHP